MIRFIAVQDPTGCAVVEGCPADGAGQVCHNDLSSTSMRIPASRPTQLRHIELLGVSARLHIHERIIENDFHSLPDEECGHLPMSMQ